MGRALPLLLALLLLAGCGDGGGDATPEPATEPGAGPPVTAEPEAEPPSAQDPGLVLLDFVDAARDGDAEALWRLLTAETQQRLGPTLEDFRAGTAVELQEGVGSFPPSGDVERVLAERVGDDLAVATIAAPRTVEGIEEHGAYAAVLRREGGEWKISIGGGPEIVPLAPEPGATVEAEVTPTIQVAGEPTDVALFLDDAALLPTDSPPPPAAGRPEVRGPVYGFDRMAPLEPGVHVATAFARDADGARALAWTFTVA